MTSVEDRLKHLGVDIENSPREKTLRGLDADAHMRLEFAEQLIVEVENKLPSLEDQIKLNLNVLQQEILDDEKQKVDFTDFTEKLQLLEQIKLSVLLAELESEETIDDLKAFHEWKEKYNIDVELTDVEEFKQVASESRELLESVQDLVKGVESSLESFKLKSSEKIPGLEREIDKIDEIRAIDSNSPRLEEFIHREEYPVERPTELKDTL